LANLRAERHVTRNRKHAIVGLIAALLATGIVLAQYEWDRRRNRNRNRPRGGYGDRYDLSDRKGVPDWEVDPQFKSDVFTFVRVRYGGWGRGGSWATDYPDSDLNFSFRLQQLTSLKVNPQPKILELTDEELFDHPFIYMIEPGGLIFTEEEIVALRRYLLNGGFLMVDDFWGEVEWDNFYREIKRVFPGEKQEPQELDLDHEIFQCVYKLTQKPQVPSINHFENGYTYEGWDGQTPHYKAVHDDKGRMMAIICHNTDLGDGWEREGENIEYFRQYAEKWSYPMGINIVFYAMTH
jgi:hypothetical protein